MRLGAKPQPSERVVPVAVEVSAAVSAPTFPFDKTQGALPAFSLSIKFNASCWSFFACQ
jgi:hypothetical protein